jgi:hypothetical protein
LSWVLVKIRIEPCRVSQLCGGKVAKSIEGIAVHLLPVDATAGVSERFERIVSLSLDLA